MLVELHVLWQPALANAFELCPPRRTPRSSATPTAARSPLYEHRCRRGTVRSPRLSCFPWSPSLSRSWSPLRPCAAAGQSPSRARGRARDVQARLGDAACQPRPATCWQRAACRCIRRPQRGRCVASPRHARTRRPRSSSTATVSETSRGSVTCADGAPRSRLTEGRRSCSGNDWMRR